MPGFLYLGKEKPPIRRFEAYLFEVVLLVSFLGLCPYSQVLLHSLHLHSSRISNYSTYKIYFPGASNSFILGMLLVLSRGSYLLTR